MIVVQKTKKYLKADYISYCVLGIAVVLKIILIIIIL